MQLVLWTRVTSTDLIRDAEEEKDLYYTFTLVKTRSVEPLDCAASLIRCEGLNPS
jgi:hypothetical protein